MIKNAGNLKKKNAGGKILNILFLFKMSRFLFDKSHSAYMSMGLYVIINLKG